MPTLPYIYISAINLFIFRVSEIFKLNGTLPKSTKIIRILW